MKSISYKLPPQAGLEPAAVWVRDALRFAKTIHRPSYCSSTCSNPFRNERRIELSFESFRFWDLRRWKVPLTEQAKGIIINNNTYTVRPVENRQYSDFMYYGPIPILEAAKANLQQNKGW